MELKHYSIGQENKFDVLLIVPYGIETSVRSGISFPSLLLIVPYGIETLYNTS